MNGPFEGRQAQTKLDASSEFEAICPPPQLLPGENLDHYRALQAIIFQDLEPKSAIEWLLAIDIAELSWEVQRYRVLRQRLLTVYRQKAVEASLRCIDLGGISSEFREKAELQIVRNAVNWKLDPTAAHEIEDRLALSGFDQHTCSGPRGVGFI